MQYRLLHSGFDTFDIAFQGAPSPETLEQLRRAKEQAHENGQAVLAFIGPQQVEMHVAENGKRGGYAFSCDTGPTGAHWWFKDNNSQSEWNIFVTVHSKAFLCQSLVEVMGGLRETLARLGFRIGQESVNRIDYAMDFLAPGFELDPHLFVAHPRTKISGYWSKKPKEDEKPSAVFSGRRCESVTVGKMPGRQIIVYDKRRDTLDKGKLFWFRVWGLDPEDISLRIWRIEVRAGKEHLKDRWNLRSFDQVFAHIGEVFEISLEDIRYVLPGQGDTNISRQQAHPIWIAARKTATEAFANHDSGLSYDEVREIDLEKCKAIYVQLIIGNAAGLAAAQGLDDSSVCEQLPDLVKHELNKRLKYRDASFWRSLERAREKLHFRSP